jgi:hypothetical protein
MPIASLRFVTRVIETGLANAQPRYIRRRSEGLSYRIPFQLNCVAWRLLVSGFIDTFLAARHHFLTAESVGTC